MSETVLYQIEKSGEVTHFDEVKNSFIGAFKIWQQLSDKYGFEMSMRMGPTQAWKAFSKGTYTPFEDVVIGTTFDNVIVLKENIPNVINAMQQYDEAHPGTSVSKQVDILKNMLEDENTIGVAWQQTTTSDSTWLPEFDDDDNEIVYNINEQSKHWNLFDDLDKAGVKYD